MPTHAEKDIVLWKMVPDLWGEAGGRIVRHFVDPSFQNDHFSSWKKYELCRMDWLGTRPVYPIVIPLELAASRFGDQWAVLIPELVDEGYPEHVLLLTQARFDSLQEAALVLFRKAAQVLISGHGMLREPDCWEQRERAVMPLDLIQAIVWEELVEYYDRQGWEWIPE